MQAVFAPNQPEESPTHSFAIIASPVSEKTWIFDPSSYQVGIPQPVVFHDVYVRYVAKVLDFHSWGTIKQTFLEDTFERGSDGFLLRLDWTTTKIVRLLRRPLLVIFY